MNFYKITYTYNGKEFYLTVSARNEEEATKVGMHELEVAYGTELAHKHGLKEVKKMRR